MKHTDTSERNYLTIKKYILDKPNKTILSKYFQLQASCLLSIKNEITFLTFYNYISFPYELSLRLFNIISSSPQKQILSKKDFTSALSQIYSNTLIDDKLNIAFCFLTNTNLKTKTKEIKNKLIYKQDILIIFRLFHFINNNENTFYEINEMIELFFDSNDSMTYQQFENNCIMDSSLLFLILVYFLYYQPFSQESLNFYIERIYNEMIYNKKAFIDDINILYAEKSKKYGQPQSLLYVYLYYNFDMKNFEIENDFNDLCLFENNMNIIREQMIDKKMINRFHNCETFGLKKKFSNKIKERRNSNLSHPSLSKSINITDRSSNNVCIFTTTSCTKPKILNKTTRDTFSPIDNQSLCLSPNKYAHNASFYSPHDIHNAKLKLGKTVISESTNLDALSGINDLKYGKTIITENTNYSWKQQNKDNLSCNFNIENKIPLNNSANEDSFFSNHVNNERKPPYNNIYIFYVIFRKKDIDNMNHESSSNHSSIEELYELTKFKMHLLDNDIYTFQHHKETNTFYFKQIITLKGLYIEEGTQAEQIIDAENKVIYYSIHLISTIMNKIQKTIIFLDSKKKVDCLIQRIQKITHYRSLQEYYDVTNLLGKGTGGVVVKAVDKRTGFLVAIKIIEKNYKDIQQIYLLRNEIDISKAVSKLNIKQISHIKDIIENQHTIYLIQDYCNSGNLETIVLKKLLFFSNEMKLNLIVSILKQIIIALKSLKIISVLHLDIKNENIVCNVSNNNVFEIRLIDFGTSKIHFREQSIYGHFGTLTYLPPEIIKGEEYSEKTDIWAFGVLAYYLLYGIQLFEGNSVSEIKSKIISLQIPFDIKNTNKQFQEINCLIKRCLERDKRKRATIEEISNFL